ncbi:MAG: DUF4271 domain-containing protein [Bacteroidales bacterium]|nr:DUF4271 domain-containing protein [Bacteroidales bacterium]
MLLNDTINTTVKITHDTAKSTEDSVFEPKYIKVNPEYINISGENNITCKEYILYGIENSEVKQTERPTMFKERTEVPHNTDVRLRNTGITHDWVFGIFLFIIFLTAMLLRFGGNIIFSFLQGCFSSSALNVNTKNGSTIHSLTLLPVMLILLPCITFLLFFTVNNFNLTEYLTDYSQQSDFVRKSPFLLWLIIYICTIIVYFFKVGLIKFFAWVFKAGRISNYYVQIMLNFGILAGFCLILPVLFVAYSSNSIGEIMLVLSLFIIVFLFITRLIRCFSVIINAFKFSHIYLFFYLCVLEILPIIVILKLLFC